MSGTFECLTQNIVFLRIRVSLLQESLEKLPMKQAQSEFCGRLMQSLVGHLNHPGTNLYHPKKVMKEVKVNIMIKIKSQVSFST